MGKRHERAQSKTVGLTAGVSDLALLVTRFENWYREQHSDDPGQYPICLPGQEDWDNQFRAWVGWDE